MFGKAENMRVDFHYAQSEIHCQINVEISIKTCNSFLTTAATLSLIGPISHEKD